MCGVKVLAVNMNTTAISHGSFVASRASLFWTKTMLPFGQVRKACEALR